VVVKLSLNIFLSEIDRKRFKCFACPAGQYTQVDPPFVQEVFL